MSNDSAQETTGASRLDAETTFAPRQQALDQLRSYLAMLVDVIDQHPEASMERDEAQWRLEELVDELARTPPSPPRVQSRWLRLVPVLREVRPDVPIATLTQLLKQAVGDR
ncbi:hypothetical protein [Saccharopolyspora elongata]|uniref:Uncharacterized protein n=1 Tax=Saccharopolyspora elongata TaxID=2530387 RepID=A0A4R4Z676_9PSEU|nr:hypothetical protein [Saccharopolyspora elongata]TDD53648.1 hypothetical protein E1288_08950 [Saccharopolyspora elongata]